MSKQIRSLAVNKPFYVLHKIH